jgi:peptidoglycan/xylan/chitin deacetylase (PgdA/CDA1 family)
LKNQLLCITILIIFIFSCNDSKIEDPLLIGKDNLFISKWYNGYKSALSFVWDDCNKDHYIKIGPVFDYFGYKCSFGITTNHLNDGYIKGYKNLLNNNHELVSHSANHIVYDKLSENQIINEMLESKNAINNLFGINPISYIHPGNGTNQFYNDNLFKYYLYSRVYNPNQDSTNFISNISSDTRLLRFKYISSLNKKFKNWIVIAGHGVDDYGFEPIKLDDLYFYLEYLNEDSVTWVEKFSHVALYNEIRLLVNDIEYDPISKSITIDMPNLNLSKFNDYFSEIPITVIINKPSKKIDFISKNIIDYSMNNNQYIVNIDLYKGNVIRYE